MSRWRRSDFAAGRNGHASDCSRVSKMAASHPQHIYGCGVMAAKAWCLLHSCLYKFFT